MTNKKTIIFLLLIAIISVIGLTIAYFAGSTSIENTFTTKSNITKYTESFVSPDNWLPGDTTEKTLIAKNMGDIDQAVRIRVDESWITDNGGTLTGWIHPDGSKSTHSTEIELSTDERVALLNLTNTSDWTKVGNYYYYNYKLAPGEDTNTFLESVTFNSKTKLNDTCETTVDYGTTSTACSSSGSDYDNATYILTLTIETVQYDLYASAWNTDVVIDEKPENVYGLTVNPLSKTYETGNKGEMFVFDHNGIIDYRYIGDSPNNYVKFNCDNDGTNCEIWRIIGVFDVDDGTGKFEKRLKLIRGEILKDSYWGYRVNDWSITPSVTTLKTYLNEDYYNGVSVSSHGEIVYGLKESARNMIGDAKYYLGGSLLDSTTHFGTADDMYEWERGSTVYSGNATQWIGKVALMYPSDFYLSYSRGVNDICYNDPYQCNETIDSSSNWILRSNSNISSFSNGATFLLNTYPVFSSTVFGFNRYGKFLWMNSMSRSDSCVAANVRPVVYLKSDVEIDSGTGTELDPYVLK